MDGVIVTVSVKVSVVVIVGVRVVSERTNGRTPRGKFGKHPEVEATFADGNE